MSPRCDVWWVTSRSAAAAGTQRLDPSKVLEKVLHNPASEGLPGRFLSVVAGRVSSCRQRDRPRTAWSPRWRRCLACTRCGPMRTRGCSSWRRCSPTSTAVTRCRRSRRVLPGMERAVRVGGVGTPRVAELAWAELGARLQISPWSARRLVADALDVRHRLPLVWAQVVARRARVSNARRVAVATRHLSVEAAGPGGCGDGRPRGRVVVLGPVRGPAGRPGRGRRPGAGRGPRGRGCRRAVRATDPVLGAGHRRVLRALHGGGDRPAGGHRGVPGRRAGRVRGPRPRGPASGQGGGVAGQPGPGRGAARRVRRAARGLRRRPAPRARAPAPTRRPDPDGSGDVPVGEPDALGPDGRVRPPGRVHPTAAARLADTARRTSAERHRPTRTPGSGSTGRGCCRP